MMSNEVRTVVYIGISAIIAAIILGLLSFAMLLRGDLATLANSEYSAKYGLEEYQTFKYYQNNIVSGDDIISCIMEFQDSGIGIYVKDLQATNDGDDRYNVTDLGRYSNGYKIFDKNTESAELDDLMRRIDKDSWYDAYLVFGIYGDDAIAEAEPITQMAGYSGVTAIKFEFIPEE